MAGHRCCVCGNSKAKDPDDTFHRIPKEPERRALWIKCFDLKEEDIKESARVCCRHFPSGNAQQAPSTTLGKRFASPMKKDARSKRAKVRHEVSVVRELSRSLTSSAGHSSRSITPAIPDPPQFPTSALTVTAGEQLRSDYSVHELPDTDEHVSELTPSDTCLINSALLAHVEYLEAENRKLKEIQPKKNYFRLEEIQHDDKLVRYYTGFISFSVLLAFFNFLGPVVKHLNYWGCKEGERVRN